MKPIFRRETTLQLNDENLEIGKTFITKGLCDAGISSESSTECITIFTRLFSNLSESSEFKGKDMLLEIKKRYGVIEILIGVQGNRIIVDLENNNENVDYIQVLRWYRDRLNFSYKRGLNVIRISVSESNKKKMLVYGIAFVAAMCTGVSLIYLMNDIERAYIVEKYINPMEGLYSNALLLLSSPLVFLSMIRNITTVWSYSDTRFKIGNTIRRVIVLSVYSAGAGIIAFLLMSNILMKNERILANIPVPHSMDYSWLVELIKEAIPSNVIEIFAAETSLPMVLFSVIFAVAICCSGAYFNMLSSFFNALYIVFSKMLQMIMVVTPLALFIAVVNDLMISGVYITCRRLIVIIISGTIGFILLMVLKMIRLRLKGVKVIPFIRKLKSAIPTNLKINSTINAVPYNIRFCNKEFGTNLRELEVNMPIMAQISQSGNCFFLTFLPLFILLWQGIEVNAPAIIAVAVLSIILSIGAPGQPGTIIIGMLVILTLLGMDTIHYMFVLIYSEVFFGWVMTLINSISDISEIAYEDFKRNPCNH